MIDFDEYRQNVLQGGDSARQSISSLKKDGNHDLYKSRLLSELLIQFMNDDFIKVLNKDVKEYMFLLHSFTHSDDEYLQSLVTDVMKLTTHTEPVFDQGLYVDKEYITRDVHVLETFLIDKLIKGDIKSFVDYIGVLSQKKGKHSITYKLVKLGMKRKNSLFKIAWLYSKRDNRYYNEIHSKMSSLVLQSTVNSDGFATFMLMVANTDSLPSIKSFCTSLETYVFNNVKHKRKMNNYLYNYREIRDRRNDEYMSRRLPSIPITSLSRQMGDLFTPKI